MFEIAIVVGSILLAVLALPRRSKRVPDNVVQLEPRRGELKATVEAAGQVIEFKPKQQTKGQ